MDNPFISLQTTENNENTTSANVNSAAVKFQKFISPTFGYQMKHVAPTKRTTSTGVPLEALQSISNIDTDFKRGERENCSKSDKQHQTARDFNNASKDHTSSPIRPPSHASPIRLALVNKCHTGGGRTRIRDVPITRATAYTQFQPLPNSVPLPLNEESFNALSSPQKRRHESVPKTSLGSAHKRLFTGSHLKVSVAPETINSKIKKSLDYKPGLYSLNVGESRNSKLLPVALNSSSAIVSHISVGLDHGLALLETGEVLRFTRETLKTENQSYKSELLTTEKFMQDMGDSKVIMVSCSDNASFVLTSDGQIFMSGYLEYSNIRFYAKNEETQFELRPFPLPMKNRVSISTISAKGNSLNCITIHGDLLTCGFGLPLESFMLRLTAAQKTAKSVNAIPVKRHVVFNTTGMHRRKVKFQKSFSAINGLVALDVGDSLWALGFNTQGRFSFSESASKGAARCLPLIPEETTSSQTASQESEDSESILRPIRLDMAAFGIDRVESVVFCGQNDQTILFLSAQGNVFVTKSDFKHESSDNSSNGTTISKVDGAEGIQLVESSNSSTTYLNAAGKLSVMKQEHININSGSKTVQTFCDWGSLHPVKVSFFLDSILVSLK